MKKKANYLKIKKDDLIFTPQKIHTTFFRKICRAIVKIQEPEKTYENDTVGSDMIKKEKILEIF